MKNLRKAVLLMGCAVGMTAVGGILTVGCSGDDNTIKDGGKEAETSTADVMMTDGGPDVGPDVPDVQVTDAGCDGNTICQFKIDLANAICTRFKTCCSNFDFNKCVSLATNTGWEYSNQFATQEALVRGNMQLDMTAAQACISSLATLSCPITTSNEFKGLSDNCYKAITGKVGAGGACINSSECQSGNYCNYVGVDAGATDAGSKLGQCATLLGPNAKCGQPPYLSTLSNEQCAYKGWPTPTTRFCNYDLYPDDAGNYFCDNLKANNTVCYANYECASELCADTKDAGTCDNGDCTCQSSKSLNNFCTTFQIKDAGPG